MSVALFALAPHPLAAGAALVLNGLGGSGFSIMQATLVYLASPPELRSRMLGILSVCIGLGPIGFVHIGLLAEAIGAQGRLRRLRGGGSAGAGPDAPLVARLVIRRGEENRMAANTT